MAISTASDALRFYRRGGETRDFLGNQNAFVASLMRQPRRGGDIANGKNPRGRLAEFIGDNMTFFNLYTDGFQPQIFGIPDNANGGNNRVKAGFFNALLPCQYGR